MLAAVDQFTAGDRLEISQMGSLNYHRQDACATTDKFSCGTGILPVFQNPEMPYLPQSHKLLSS
ncbi:MAG: hypothetical protein QQW96_07970 [Tychonema bourrellyi B0820]|nr:hypothetical protein [Tychonema bourrellyi B0820]